MFAAIARPSDAYQPSHAPGTPPVPAGSPGTAAPAAPERSRRRSSCPSSRRCCSRSPPRSSRPPRSARRARPRAATAPPCAPSRRRRATRVARVGAGTKVVAVALRPRRQVARALRRIERHRSDRGGRSRVINGKTAKTALPPDVRVRRVDAVQGDPDQAPGGLQRRPPADRPRGHRPHQDAARDRRARHGDVDRLGRPLVASTAAAASRATAGTGSPPSTGSASGPCTGSAPSTRRAACSRARPGSSRRRPTRAATSRASTSATTRGRSTGRASRPRASGSRS